MSLRNPMLGYFCAAWLFALNCSLVFADGTQCPDGGRLGHTPTLFEGEDIIVVDSIAYVAGGRDVGVQIYDISDPQDIRGLNSYDSSGTDSPLRVGYHNGLLYVFDKFRSMMIIDVSNPYSPTRLSFVDLPGRPFDYQFINNEVYVACGDWVIVFDISDPYQPVERWSFKGYSFRSVYVDGSLMYLASYRDGLRIYDISDVDDISELGEYDPSEFVTDMAIRDNIAYLGDEGGQVRVVDIGNPSSPQVVGVRDLVGAVHSIELEGERLYGSCSSNQLFTFDIADPMSPAQVGAQNLYGQGEQFIVKDRLAYVLSRYAGLEVLDVESPPNQDSPLVSSINDLPSFQQVCVFDSVAALAWNGQIWIYDLTDIRNPTLAETLSFTGAINSMRALGSRLYIARGSRGFDVHDISNRFDPVLITTVLTPEPIDDVVLDGLTAIAQGNDVYLYDVTDLAQPELVANLGMRHTELVSVAGSYLYVYGEFGDDSSDTFRVYDISNPGAPVLVTDPAYFEVRGMAYDSGTLVVADSRDLTIFEVQQGGTLQAVAGYTLPASFTYMEFHEGRLIVLTQGSMLIQVDLSDPRAPRHSSSYDYLSQAYGVGLYSDFALLPTNDLGTLIVDLSEHCASCPADLNADGALNFFDVSAFLVGYLASDPLADWNGDGVFNFFDVSGFLVDFQGGCP